MIKSIAIDATHLGTGQATGVEKYVDALLPRMSVLLVEQGVAVSWIGHHEASPIPLPKGVKWIHSPHQRFWSQTTLLALLNRLRPSVFFTPSGLAPLGYKGLVALTVHDMAAYQFPQAFSRSQHVRLRFMIGRNARRAKLILTPSQYSADQMQRIWGLPLEKIVVTALGFEYSAAPPKSVPNVKPDQPILLYTGRIERKKNILVVVQAFARYAENHKGQLVLAGKDGFGAEEIHECIAALPTTIRERIICPGYISDGQKSWLFEHASLCLVPCLVEGFGLPVLEAFAANVPVLASKAGSLPEVGGDAAAYVVHNIPEAWQEKLEELLTDQKLLLHYKKLGKDRVQSYTWDRTAEESTRAIISLN